MAQINVFATAKKTTGNEKKDDKHVVTIADKTFYEKAEKAFILDGKIKDQTSQFELLAADLKAEAKKSFIDVYVREKRNPGSIVIATEKIKDKSYQFTFTPTDSYGKLTESAFDTLEEIYGDEAVEKVNSFSFNNDVLNKHYDKIVEAISKAISGIKTMTDDEKADLLVATTTYKVKGGSIDRMIPIAEKLDDELSLIDRIDSSLSNLKPTFQLKALKENKA